MKKKTKIVIGSCVFAGIIAALIAIIVIGKTSLNTNVSQQETFQVWQETPFDYSKTIQTYSSYKQPFREAVSDLREDLTEESQKSGTELSIVSAYMTEENTPTLIVAYRNPEGGTNFMICRYKNNALDKTFIHGGTNSSDGMDEALAEYIENAKPYSALAVTEDVDSAIDHFVKE